ncbi:MAG: Transposase DDE domain protein [Cenarchaeum symbiont of Oopsacas minuta]|nr:Transposase DDE domain protein [Cenarchaeum symbiont of Oopsacas minuta]
MHIDAFTPNDAMLKNQAEWKKRVRYGQRWIIEVVFSAFKRVFGDSVMSRKWDHIVQELRLKVWVYNMFCDASLSTP